ncbi:uncharacterized protein B0H18DRAFT_958331 [Fomitopsis serialis]|uniref:uncharacterized protein n=1 Tax=Fomitopsis serialis TaxID=139415 RepID=UPI002007CCB2|nr:uncharacterized protein B0H18DRAFT_958331 [Neoantrodia serialis]KAH9917480.1 hypothetical protein B0H18DRAFT_958331 [Neoantrodia serialis]
MSQLRRVEKIKTVLETIKEQRWTSVNDFLLAYYNSNDPDIAQQARRNIAYTDGKRFAPAQILDSWLESAHGETKHQLELMITHKAADILVKESTKACHDHKLKLASTKVDTAYLSTDFALSKLAAMYQAMLPCMWLLLMTVLTATNDYERKKKKEKRDKDSKIPPVIVIIISMLLFARNRATNLFQVVIGIFLSSTGAGRRVINTFNHMGLSNSGKRSLFTLRDLALTPEKQAQLTDAFRHHTGGRRSRKLWKRVKESKPQIRVLSHEKTEFYPLPALAQEEASVAGTIKVVVKLFTQVLGLVEEVVVSELRLLVGDWLTIRNLRLMKDEVAEEFTAFARMDWVQEVAMPFHFQLNAMYMLFRTHLGFPGDNNPSSLEHHRMLLKRSKLDPKKPEYNKAKELVYHSLIARILDCTRTSLGYDNHQKLKSWKPKWEDFNAVVNKIVADYASTRAAHTALLTGDEVLAHSILFIRDALLFREFSEAIQDADVGRMWLVHDFWVFMMRGAGCHNYGNEILEMKAQFTMYPSYAL